MEVETLGVEVKKCPDCEKTFPATTEYFPLGSNYRCGLRPLCRICYNRRNRERYSKRAIASRRRQAESKKKVQLGIVPAKMVGLTIDNDRMRELEQNIDRARRFQSENTWAKRYRRDIGLVMKECNAWKQAYMELTQGEAK